VGTDVGDMEREGRLDDWMEGGVVGEMMGENKGDGVGSVDRVLLGDIVGNDVGLVVDAPLGINDDACVGDLVGKLLTDISILGVCDFNEEGGNENTIKVVGNRVISCSDGNFVGTVMGNNVGWFVVGL